jgi:hypothetical protein
MNTRTFATETVLTATTIPKAATSTNTGTVDQQAVFRRMHHTEAA